MGVWRRKKLGCGVHKNGGVAKIKWRVLHVACYIL
jgi:hypothetical protein